MSSNKGPRAAEDGDMQILNPGSVWQVRPWISRGVDNEGNQSKPGDLIRMVYDHACDWTRAPVDPAMEPYA